jgi:hypothetical protein
MDIRIGNVANADAGEEGRHPDEKDDWTTRICDFDVRS